MNKTLNLSDIGASQYHRQFTETPANILANTSKYFKTEEVVLLITEVEAAGAYTLSFVDACDQLPTKAGSGHTQYYLPIYCKELKSATGITKISGYFSRVYQSR